MLKKTLITFGITLTLIILLSIVFRDQIFIEVLEYESRNNNQTKKVKIPLPTIDKNIENELNLYLSNHHKTPNEYIISCFQDHDVIFLGEYHRIKHDVDLVKNIIPLLYENGIYILGIEFARHDSQRQIDSLISADSFNEQLARQIVFNWDVTWGYQEYVDLFKSAWKFNKSLDSHIGKFRILGLNAIEDWSYFKADKDRKDSTIWEKVLPEGDWDQVMASVIEQEIIDKNKKALIYSGIHHAFTKYKQPVYDFDKNKLIRFNDKRMGNRIYQLIGERAMTICLHFIWPSSDGKSNVYPVDGKLDAFMKKYSSQFLPVGFDVKNSPFGTLLCKNTSYKYGYSKFVLSDFCDGYIFQKPFSEYKGVTPIDNFITDRNLTQAKREIKNPKIRVMFNKVFISSFFKTFLNWSIQKESKIEYRFNSFE